MASTRLLLIRHGEVHERWRGTIYGRLDVELSERGLEQSRRIGEAFRGESIDLVVTSGLQRAEVAAAELRRGRDGLERVDDPRLLELDRGAWAGRSLDEIRESEPEAFAEWQRRRGAVRAPGGEDPDEVPGRVVPAVRDWVARVGGAGGGGTVAVVAHLWVVRSVVATVLGMPMARSPQLGWAPGGVCELEWPDRGGGAGGGQIGGDLAGVRVVRLGV
ncbi:MAG: histidine phosphatase family protein [Planctomycetota bacterium]